MRTKSSSLMEKIIDFIDDEYAEKGRVPTIMEIAKALEVSKSCVGNYITEMTQKGLIENVGGNRGIKTKTMIKSANNVQVPVIGSISCGLPLFAEENIEAYLPIPKTFLGNGKYFILKANGESMINAGINDGDYVIVRQQETAEEGQIIVALIDNEATLKRFYLDKAKKKVRLHPENDNLKDMYFNSVVIQGIAVKVIKDLI